MTGVKKEVNEAIQKNKASIIKFARTGFFTKGFVYFLIGTLTTMSAFRLGGENADRQKVFETIYQQPFGRILLGLTALGLLAYAAWRLYEAIKNPADKKTISRLGYAGSGLLYGSFAVSAGRFALTSSSGSGGSTQSAIAEALQQPFGKIIVAIVALGTLGKAIYQLYRAFTGKLGDEVYPDKDKEKIVRRAGVMGFAARGVVLGIIGYFLVRAAFYENSGEATDTEGAFAYIENGFGPWLLGVVAFGLICYGVFMMMKGMYSRFKV